MHSVIAARVIVDMPIRKIERRLESIGDAVFELMPEIELVRIRRALASAMELPRDPVLQFHLAFIGGSDFVGEGEAALRRVNGMARAQKHQRSDSRENDPKFSHPRRLAEPHRVRCRWLANF